MNECFQKHICWGSCRTPNTLTGFPRFHHNSERIKSTHFFCLLVSVSGLQQPAVTLDGVFILQTILVLVRSHPVKSGAQFRRLPQEGAGPLPASPSYYGGAGLSRHQATAGRVPP